VWTSVPRGRPIENGHSQNLRTPNLLPSSARPVIDFGLSSVKGQASCHRAPPPNLRGGTFSRRLRPGYSGHGANRSTQTQMIEAVFIIMFLSPPGIPQSPRSTVHIRIESMEECRRYEALWHSRDTFRGKIETMCLDQKSTAIAK
jgi:hypothetical protein